MENTGTWPCKYGLVVTILAAALLISLVAFGFFHANQVRSLRADIARLSAIDTAGYNNTIRALDASLKKLQASYDSLDAARPPFHHTPTQNLSDAQLQVLLKARLKGDQ